MNKHELKSALNKIKPREELIEDTIRKANELRLGQSKKRSAFAFEGFNFKLAGAVCAFAIVLSLGILAGSNGLFTTEKNPPIEAMSLRSSEAETNAPQRRMLQSDVALAMIEDAKAENAPWAVLEGSVSGCYPASSNEDKIHYLVQIDDVNLCDLGPDVSIASEFENGLVAAFDIESGAEKFNEFLNLMSTPIYIRLTEDNINEETSWKIVDFAPIK